MPFISSAQSTANHHFPVFSDIINTRLKLGKIENLHTICVNIADRFVGSENRPAEQLLISKFGENSHADIVFTGIVNDHSLTSEARGEAILRHIAESIAPILMTNGADNVAAHAAAFEIAAQLGDPEFATLEQTAVQKAMDNRMSGFPVSRTHIVWGQNGEVLVHKTSQWAAYIDTEEQEVRTSDGVPILKVDVVSAFWLERTDSCIQRMVDEVRKFFGNASGTKHFELHGKVQRCLLDTPDAELKTTLIRNTSSFIDTILNGLARIFGLSGIRIEPLDRLEDTFWEITNLKLLDFPLNEALAIPRPPLTILDPTERQIQASSSGMNERSDRVAITITTDASGSGVVKSQGRDGAHRLVSSQFETRNRENQAATKIQRAFGIHVTKKVTQASDGLRMLLNKIGAEPIKSIKELHVDDIIVVAPAQNGPKKSEWYKHGFIYQITKIAVDNFCGNLLHLSANIGQKAKIFSHIPFTEYYQARDSEGQPVKTSFTSQLFFVCERSFEHKATKLDHLAQKGVIYKMAPAVPFALLEELFKKTAENNLMGSYSRQNNCNHAIYATLSALHGALSSNA
ncbi:TPA: hypothetical protein H2C15_004426 [Salmonella enterica]|nr:hypothetical protein [Salmonella enterica]